jgi:hypothetical protein
MKMAMEEKRARRGGMQKNKFAPVKINKLLTIDLSRQ